MRINKYLSSCGLGSRRGVEPFVLEGRVKVNGNVITDLSYDVGQEDNVLFDNDKITPILEKRYYLIYKPKGYVSTVSDKFAKHKVVDLIDENHGIYPAGRLDKDSEGLMILTNDGDYANRLMHPSFDGEKEYYVEASIGKDRIQERLDKLMRFFKCGTLLGGKKTRSAKIEMLGMSGGVGKFKIRLKEGRNRQIRRVFSKAGMSVVKLVRVELDGYKLDGMQAGEVKEFKPRSA